MGAPGVLRLEIDAAGLPEAECYELKVACALKVILREVCAIFPYPYIHLGGDESVIDRNWAKCAQYQYQTLQRQKGFAAPRFLMQPFFEALLPTVWAAGKCPILWYELDNIHSPAREFFFDHPDDVVLVTWRNALTPTYVELKLTGKAGSPLILAPGEHAYWITRSIRMTCRSGGTGGCR